MFLHPEFADSCPKIVVPPAGIVLVLDIGYHTVQAILCHRASGVEILLPVKDAPELLRGDPLHVLSAVFGLLLHPVIEPAVSVVPRTFSWGGGVSLLARFSPTPLFHYHYHYHYHYQYQYQYQGGICYHLLAFAYNCLHLLPSASFFLSS